MPTHSVETPDTSARAIPSGAVRIRAATSDDVALLREIVADAFAGREAIIGRHPEPLSMDFAHAVVNRYVILAEDAHGACGCLVAHPSADPSGSPASDLYIEAVAVRRRAQGAGVGRALMAAIEADARRRGVRTLSLYTTARVAKNLAFYRALGFVEARRTGMSAFERVHFTRALPPPVARKAAVDALYGRRRVHRHRVDPAYDRLALDLRAAAEPFDGVEVRLEVGFGGGEHLLHEARRAPTVSFIGVEPFETGMMRTAAAIEAEGLPNVRLYMGDARRVLDWLADAILSRVDILYPDPWHKQRHWKRRFISTDGLDRLARTVRGGGEVRFASDIAAYVDWTRAHVEAHPAFALERDEAEPWDGWPGTRYEAKALREGRTPRYLTLRRG